MKPIRSHGRVVLCMALAPAVAAVALALLAVLGPGSAPAKDDPPQTPHFSDLDGRDHTPLAQPDQKATVFFFLLTDCPVSNAFAPEIKRICTDYQPKKVAAFIVHADPAVTVELAKKHVKDYGFSCPVLLDPTHVLVRATGASMAPEVAVVAPDGKVRYRGRINDLYVDYGKRRAEPTHHDLRLALDAVLQGKEVALATTKVIGCYLPEPKKQ
jgi:hypothetical protein